MGGGRVVSHVRPVLRKADRIGNFVWPLLDRDGNAHAGEEIDGCGKKIGDRPGLKRHEPFGASAGPYVEPMSDEIELDVKYLIPGGDRRRAESPGRDIERRLPAMIKPGG